MTRDVRFQPTTLDRAERLALMSLSGGCGERRFCGEAFDGGDAIDLEKARRYLGHWYNDAQVEAEIARLTDEANRLVRQRWARKSIRALAGHLLACGKLSGDAISRIFAGPAPQSRKSFPEFKLWNNAPPSATMPPHPAAPLCLFPRF